MMKPVHVQKSVDNANTWCGDVGISSSKYVKYHITIRYLAILYLLRRKQIQKTLQINDVSA